MADETIRGTRGWQDADRGGPKLHQSQKINLRVVGTTTKVGMFVTHTGETEPDAAPAITTDGRPIAYVAKPATLQNVLLSDPDWNIDAVLPDNEYFEGWRLGCGKVVPVHLEATAGPVAVVKGDLLAVGTEAGKVRKFVYADATAATDSLLEVVGTVHEADAGHATDDHVILMVLDK